VRDVYETCLLALLLASATTAGAGRWHTDQGDVRATCVMTIGGSFDAKTTPLNASLSQQAGRVRDFQNVHRNAMATAGLPHVQAVNAARI